MPYGVDWEFSSSAGIASNGSPWNAPTAREGTQFAFLQNKGSCAQRFAVAAAGTHTIAFRAAVRNFQNHSHDFAVEVDGQVATTVKASQMATGQWRDFATKVDLPPGPHVLAFVGLNTAGGDNSSFIDDLRVADPAGNPVVLKNPGFEAVPLPPKTFVYAPPARSTPAYRLDAVVCTSGRTIRGRLLDVRTGAVPPTPTIASSPDLYVNGLRVGGLDPARVLVSSGHDAFLMALPDGVAIVPGDDVTLSAGDGWATAAGDYAGGFDAMPIINHAGRSSEGGDPESATRRVGLDFGHLASPWWSTYALPKNLVTRIGSWGPYLVSVDAKNLPTATKADTLEADLIVADKPNFLDATNMPAPVGLYAVGWSGTPTTTCGLKVTGLTVVGRADMQNPGDGQGGGRVSVWEVSQPKPGPWKITLTLTDKTRKPKLDYLVAYGPGDFEAIDGKPVVLDDVHDPLAISNTFLDRTRGGIGTLRFGDCLLGFGGTSACEPEHLMKADRASWAGWAYNWDIHWTRARPWTPDASPYVYTPLFGEPFPATLGEPLPGDAKAGDTTVVSIPDAATAPVIEGLVLSIGDERCRVLVVSSDMVKIERGSERTTPAAHDPGPILVSSRLKVSSLGDWKKEDNQVTELVSKDPHRLRTGMQPTFDGEGWAPWPYADGSTCNSGHGMRYYSLCVFVTGPNSIVVVSGKSTTHANTTLAAAVDLDPAKCYSQVRLPEGFNLPHAFCAALVGRTGADGVINMPFAASDSYVDAVAKIWRDATTAGQTIWIELINEVWNWAYIGASSQSRFCWLLGKQPDGSMLWQVRRTGQMVNRFRAVFAEVGRAGDVRGFINMQRGSGSRVDGYVSQAMAEGLPIPDVAIAPYTEFFEAPELFAWLESADPAQAVDAWSWNLVHGVANHTGPVPDMKAHRAAVDAVNLKYGTQVKCLGYECGVERAWPAMILTLADDVTPDATTFRVACAYPPVVGTFLRFGPEWMKVAAVADAEGGTRSLTVGRGACGTTAVAFAKGMRGRNAFVERSRDLVYHPQFRIAQMDEFALWQRYFDWACISVFSLDYVGADNGTKLWGMYHHLLQPHGRGDGRDGKHDNTACTASPGPGMKPATTNQDANVVSTRGGAFVTWNRWAGANE